MSKPKSVSYADSGVHLEALDAVKARIGKAVASTHGPEVLSRHGAFGGLFHLVNLPERDPVLVASVDGVGTKVKVAQMAGRFDGLGHDIVNHCIDDLLVGGARPLFFLDYLASSRMKNEVVEGVVTSIADACKQSGIALLAGETAEMPGVYCEGEFDVVGCIVGVIGKEDIIDGSRIAPGNVLLGLPSTGLHTNGYSLARRVLVDTPGRSLDDPVLGSDISVGEALLAPHKSYFHQIFKWKNNEISINGLSHITGGGYEGNLIRVIPGGCKCIVDTKAWEPLPIFRHLQETGPIEAKEMYRVFNMGIGMIAMIPAEQQAQALELVPEAVVVGRIEAGNGIELTGL